MTIINRLPKGLQEFLGNTAQGQNPSELRQDVFPTIDMSPFWSLDRTKYKRQTGTITTIGNGAFITIPPGEVWMPFHMSAIMTGFTVGDVVRMNLSLFPPNGDNFVLASGVNIGLTDIVERVGVSYDWKRPILYSDGMIFGGGVERLDIASPSEAITLNLMYVEMRD